MQIYAPNEQQYKDVHRHQYHSFTLQTTFTVTDEGVKPMITLRCDDCNEIVLEILKPITK